jgi:hypothetical protein
MVARQIKVLVGDTLIGTAMLEDWDRSMAVAGGVFAPTDAYSPTSHAALLEGVEMPAYAGLTGLAIEAEDGTRPSFEHAAIVDWAKTAGELYGREVEVYGFDFAFFGRHEDRS